MRGIEEGNLEGTVDGVDHKDGVVPYLAFNKKHCAEYNKIIGEKEILCKCGLKREKHENSNSKTVQNKDGIERASPLTDAYGDVSFKGAPRRATAKVCFR